MSRVLLAAALLCGSACRVGPDGEFESVSAGTSTSTSTSTGGLDAGTGGDDGADETGFPPAEQECDFELGANPLGASECTSHADCCAEPTGLIGLVGDAACPSLVYPNNWQCDTTPNPNVCVHQGTPSSDFGCSEDEDCLFPGFVCHVISSVGHCVAPCATDSECADDHNMPNSSCLQPTGATTKFCMQEQP